MPKVALAQKLLALFTSAECAEGIAGDLAEGRDAEGRGRAGSLWFWRQVLTTMAALVASRFSSAPRATLGLTAVGFWLFASSALAGVVAVMLFPQHIGSPVSWVVLSSLWWGGALCTGALLVTIAQTRAMAACVVLAITGEALLTALGLIALKTPTMVFHWIAGVAPAMLLTGGAIVRLRMINSSNHIPEQER
jgi:hypothetical protein